MQSESSTDVSEKGRSHLLCGSQNLVYNFGTVLSDPRRTVLAVTITHQSKPDPVKHLASAVFTQALRDCGFLRTHRREEIDRKVKEEAINFLTSGDETFRFWCHALNQHPETVQSELRRRLARS